MDSFENFATATVSDGNYDDSATEIDVLPGDGNRLPNPPFNLTWWNATDYPDPSDDPGREIVRVTDRTDDTLTIVRAQEDTAASDHNVAGKTYKVSNGPTKKMITDLIALLGDIFGSGTAVLVDTDAGTIYLRQAGTSRYMQLSSAGAEVQATMCLFGDINGEQNSSYCVIDDTSSRFLFNNLDLATSQIESASIAVGTIGGKLKITNADGSVVKYIALYNSIT